MYLVNDASGGSNVLVRLQPKAGGGLRCAVTTAGHGAADAARQLSELGVWQYLLLDIGRHGVAVVALHVHEAPSLRRFAEARLSSLAHAGTSHAPKVATLTADTTFITRGRHMTDHAVACTSSLTHCPSYLQALEPSARPVQVFR